jgi:hypothetical protein
VKKRFSEEQVIGFLRETESGTQEAKNYCETSSPQHLQSTCRADWSLFQIHAR